MGFADIGSVGFGSRDEFRGLIGRFLPHWWLVKPAHGGKKDGETGL
jgi:hypothetical protein